MKLHKKSSLKNTAKTNDLTVGSIKKLLLVFAFPTLLSNLFQQFYNLADTAIAGHIIGDDAIVAIGATSSIFSLVFTFAFGLNGGFGIIISQCFGAKDYEGLNKAIAKSIAINIGVSLFISCLSIVIIKPVLVIMNTPKAQIDDAFGYIIVILCGAIVSMLYNLESTILRSLGDSKTPLYFLVFASILNIALDYVFIKYIGTGVIGAALATVAAQLFATVLCFAVIKKNFSIIHIEKKHFFGDREMLSRMLSAGLTMALMNSIFSIGSIVMQRSINALGETIIAAHFASRKLAEMFMQPLVTLGTACSTFVGQNYGAKKYGRISKGIKWSAIYALAFSVIAFVVLFFFGGKLAELVTGTQNEQIISNTQMYLKINSPFYFVLGMLFILRFSIQSVDRQKPPLISSSMELVIKVLAAFVFIPSWGYLGACLAEPISWCLGAVYLLFTFNSTLRKMDK